MSGLDGQFVAVTLAALWGGWVLLRPLRPLLSLRGKKKAAGPAGPACGHCSAGSSCGSSYARGPAGGETLVTLGGGSRHKTTPEQR